MGSAFVVYNLHLATLLPSCLSVPASLSLSYGRRINEEVSKWNEAAASSSDVIYDRRRATEEKQISPVEFFTSHGLRLSIN